MLEILLSFVLILFSLGFVFVYIYSRFLSSKLKLSKRSESFHRIGPVPLNDFREKALDQLQDKKIKHVVFVHGTFVGDDPWVFWRWVKSVLPWLYKVIRILKKITRGSSSFLANDIGNFSVAHTKAIENLDNGHVSGHLFTWSSANNHIGRVDGAIELIRFIKNLSGNVVLIGHSHAAQIFALVSRIYKEEGFKSKVFESFPYEKNLAWEESEKKEKDFFAITLGSPVRYEWSEGFFKQVSHFINHRGERDLVGSLSGILTTRDGDYVQYLATHGSDFPAMSKKDKAILLKLDELLGKGEDIGVWRKELKDKKRKSSNVGQSFLVDYRDGGKFLNFQKSIFGHGLYTKKDYLFFHLYQGLLEPPV